MDKPLIGLVPLADPERDSYWMLPGYMEGVAQAGGVPVMLPMTDDPRTLAQLAAQTDGLLFTGGHDISPALYSQPVSPRCGPRCTVRDAMEVSLLRLARRMDKPVLGICRGIQLINAAMGGTLYQDLPSERPCATVHQQKPPYDVPVHAVRILSGSPLHRLLGQEQLRVNSYHHQAVKTLAPGLCAMAVSEDGLIEAVYAPAMRFCWAVQWHPEFSFRRDPASRQIFARFVRACTADTAEAHAGGSRTVIAPRAAQAGGVPAAPQL